ncbi:nucleoside hydrolase [Arcticibacterium luteifluviistationis]|uniref:Nucleoside hydrolase n=1 Tax=Arcticibacterium luteifluviistationis TaxID=1784714 RepID=A0A2Z4GE98_9BACT|nr:nucleoside hydrolase [Arcticibacterium luteifluviistationis]AWV99632.1 nucleoside hydrolase [Arcticibacterium luteifluviistationis]
MPQKIIIDTDPGVDDAMAIQFALNSPELEVIGLTTVYGNVNLELTTANALKLLEAAGRGDIPVAKGAAKPLSRPFGGGVAFVHGDDGLGNIFSPESSLKPIAQSAEDFIIEQIKKYPNEIILAPLGPLTNIALALQKAPEIAELVKEVVIMGGNAFWPGNASPAAEANILNDPEAADYVLGACWPMVMIGLDVTETTLLSHKEGQEVRAGSDSELNKMVCDAYVFYEQFNTTNNKIDGSFLHDPSVIAYMIDASIFSGEEYLIRVETQDGLSLGKTWPFIGDEDVLARPASEPWRGRPAVNVMLKVDNERLVTLLKERLK